VIEPGAPAPSLTLQNLDNQSIELSETWSQGSNSLLVFLRHLGWLPCREHVGQLLSSKSEINARHTKVVIISFGIPALVQKWIKETQSSFQFLIDLDKKAYQVYGLESSLLRSWSPKIWLAYARLMAQGRKWRGIQGDSGQMGGDLIVDQKGIIRMAYRSHDPADRPKIEEILHILDGIKTWRLMGELVQIMDMIWTMSLIKYIQCSRDMMAEDNWES